MIDYYSDTFKNELDKLDKNKTYLIYCRTGRRTGLTLDIMEEPGFIEVYNMLGGITQWQAKGYPVI
jgi:rhodanese-related sulfurtransferase